MDNTTLEIVASPLSLESLEEKLKNRQTDIKEFRKAWYSLHEAKLKLQQFTEYAMSLNAGDKDWQRLLFEMTGSNIAGLMDKLKRTGYTLRSNSKNRELIKAFDTAAFRLLEQTRAGKKDDVYYGILRIFVAQKRNVPGDIVTAFKYEGDIFKVLIFSFLSGVLGKEESD